jgi:hypothetical protein
MAFNFKVNCRTQAIDVDGTRLLQALSNALSDVEDQLEGTAAFSFTAALCGEITIRDGRVVDANLDAPRLLRMDAMPVIDLDPVRP